MRDVLLDAPIPGMSLTHELGDRPWQSPPKAATVGEAMAKLRALTPAPGCGVDIKLALKAGVIELEE